MHYKSLASIAAIGLALIAPLVSAHPADQPSKTPSYKTIPPKIKMHKTTPHKTTSTKTTSTKTTSTKTTSSTSIPYIDYGECYRVKSPACDKAYDDALAEFKKENPDYDFTAEPYPDSKRDSNICKCTGSLLDGGYKVTSNSIPQTPLPSYKDCWSNQETYRANVNTATDSD
ncbi:hypothetical protein MMC22_010337, partial [Lobaria immixta]|nr:hypothetical protein [Lobaria immixta]